MLKKTNRNSISVTNTPKTPGSKESNGKATPGKGTPTKRSQNDTTKSASKSAAKSPKMDAETLAQEFIKYDSFVMQFIDTIFKHSELFVGYGRNGRILGRWQTAVNSKRLTKSS